MAKLVIYTDLDGTLLREGTGGFDHVQMALGHLANQDIPLVFASAKTRVEIRHVQAQLHVEAPFIAENGSAVFVPGGCFPFYFPCDHETFDYRVIELGVPYHVLRDFLSDLPPIEGLEVRGFGDMSIDEVVAATGLDSWAAARAKRREYDETLILNGSPQAVAEFMVQAQSRGFQVTHGGNFYHLLGPTDKGRAARVLTPLFAQKFGSVVTAAIGDASNDLPLLKSVDFPIWLGRADSGEIGNLEREGLNFMKADTWGQAVDLIFRRAEGLVGP